MYEAHQHILLSSVKVNKTITRAKDKPHAVSGQFLIKGQWARTIRGDFTDLTSTDSL